MISTEDATRHREFLASLSEAEGAFIQTMKRAARLRALLRGAVEGNDEETFKSASRELEGFLVFLMQAAALLTVEYRIVEARAVLVAVELMIELSGDHDLIERMAQRREEYELQLSRAAAEVATLEVEERQAVSRVLKRLARQEIARVNEVGGDRK